MTAAEFLLRGIALWFGIFLAIFGLAFWIAGFANPRTNVIHQNIYAATALTSAIPLLVYAFTGSAP